MKLSERAEKESLAKLTPNSIDVSIDGSEVRVATTREENAILNMLLAAQGRAEIQRALKKWHDLDETPSPKELRDIAAAMKDIASFSAEIYSNAVESAGIPAVAKRADSQKYGDLDFSKISAKPKGEINVTGSNQDGKEDTKAGS